MIAGSVTVDREIVISIEIRDRDGGVIPIHAVVDTGFNGYLALPLSTLHACSAAPAGMRRVELGDGRLVELDLYLLTVLWNDGPLEVLGLHTETTPPRASCRYGFAVRHLLGIVAGSLGCWAIGGVAAMGLASLSPEFYRRTIIGVPSEIGPMLAYFWVGGSIWGVQLGGLVSVVFGLVVLRGNWRRRHGLAEPVT